MPPWILVMGQIISFTNGLPVLAVTAYGALTNVHRSGIRWSMPAKLLLLSMFGWAAGVIPAIIDGVISVNRVMHNTLWVPGHFHFYLLLGLWAMLFGFMYHVIRTRAGEPDSAVDQLGFLAHLVGGLVFSGMLLMAGQASVPRRKERGRVCTMREIAAFYGISMEHLRKVIHKMARLGYLDSARGRGGGVTLGRAPDKIRIGELIVAMEADLSIVNCEALACVLTGGCSLKLALNRARGAFIDSLNRTTLADLLGHRRIKCRFRSIDITRQPARLASQPAGGNSVPPWAAVTNFPRRH